MLKPLVFLLAVSCTILTGCTGYDIGGSHPDESAPSGSYQGQTLNSPVADQNPHPGGDSSYPSSVSDQGLQPTPPDKANGPQ